ncbi:unnamed protein product [Owenia fusiformis]|uniref:Uncharacterized protein n=1 Tax=Owenia fusiformis TaxID=6347 RepID=A0A8J1UME3_OWEFU|nr:unnamed protein product [Owenia fusiformis]
MDETQRSSACTPGIIVTPKKLFLFIIIIIILSGLLHLFLYGYINITISTNFPSVRYIREYSTIGNATHIITEHGTHSAGSDILARLQNSIPVTNLTQEMYDRAFLWRGNTAKLKKIFRDAIVKKRPISMATIGGSVSAGGGVKASCEFPCLHMEILAEWLRTVLGVRVESRNVAMSGANSELYGYCLDAHVDAESTDILIGELSTNDRLSFSQPGFKERGRPFEEVIRNTKMHREKPVFISAGFIDSRLLILELTNGHNCSFDLEQNYYKPLLKYYDITGVSLHRVVCPVYGLQPGFRMLDVIGFDLFHPGLLSHRYVAIILMKFFAGIIEGTLKSLEVVDPPEPSLPTPLYNSTWITNPVCFTNTRHVHPRSSSNQSWAEMIKSNISIPVKYDNLRAIEMKGFHKFFSNSSMRRYEKYDIMEHRNDVMDGYQGNKVGDWITMELVASGKPPGSVQQVLSVAYVTCDSCDLAVISVWLGIHEKPISPVFNFKTVAGSAGVIIMPIDGLNLSDYVKEHQVFNVTMKLNWDYNFLLHTVMIAWR